MTTIRAFFLQLGRFFSNFRKRAMKTSPPPPLPPSSYAPVYSMIKFTFALYWSWNKQYHVNTEKLSNLCNVRKSCCSLTYISLKLRKCAEKHATLTRQHRKPFCSLVVAKTKVKSAFLLWHHHGDTNTAETSQSLTNKTSFCGCVANNFFQNNVLSLTQASSLSFWHGQ